MPEGKQLRNCMKVKTVEESLKTNLQTTARKTSRGELSVSFSDVEVRSHEMILGDNPAVTSGAPVTIDWIPQGEASYKISVYEREVIRVTRRKRRKLLITVSNR